tara:strand:- start:54 stop:548 length:495 start_codon:yes stop_codon:yes gene_type:complete
MEKKIQNHIDAYMIKFKESVRDILLSNESEGINTKLEKIFELDGCIIDVNSFIRKKRARNIISDAERCCAYKAAQDRCTRKKRDGCNVCGTHLKGTPHGMIDMDNQNVSSKKIEIFTLDIGGIIYYVDNEQNVYASNEIMNGKTNPTKIGKYKEEGGQRVLLQN